MRTRLLLALTCAAVAVSSSAQQQMVCPPGPAVSGKPCESFHFHAQVYRPDTRKFVDITGMPGYASQGACDRVRDASMKRNLAVVDFFKRVKGDEKYEPDRHGPCHCDMTRDKTNPAFLTDAQRQTQMRNLEDARLTVRERLLDNGVTSDSELVRSLIMPPPALPMVGGSKLVSVPAQTAVAAVLNTADDLKATNAVDTRPPVAAALDLPLVAVTSTGQMPVATAPAVATGAQPVAKTPNTVQPAAPMTTQQIEAPVPDAPADAVAGESAAENFISYETERIQNVLKAAIAISDESIKSKIFESTQQRAQLLSNLRALIEGSGERSRLATAARTAQSEADHLAFAEKLFGSGIAPHWAPRDAADVIVPAAPDVDTEPERALRDTTGRFNEQQRKRALYVMLARTQPTEDQQLWLSTVIDTFLR